MKWASYFPEECPPGDARPAEGTVFRIVMNNPPLYEDFLSYKVLNPETDYKQQECQSCGVSVFGLVGDADTMRKRIPALRNGMVAVGELEQNLGLIKATPVRGNSHLTWWISEDVQPQSRFALVTQ